MRHFIKVEAVGDVIEPVTLNQVAGKDGQAKQVAKTRLCVVNHYNNQEFRSSFAVEAWGEAAARLAAVPVGHTIVIFGKPQNYKYNDQQGNEKWGTRMNVDTVADCGPSEFQHQPKQPQANANAHPYTSAGAGGTGGNYPQNHTVPYPPQMNTGQHNAYPQRPPAGPPPQQGGFRPPQQPGWAGAGGADDIPF